MLGKLQDGWSPECQKDIARREMETKVAARSPSTLQKHVEECGLYLMGIGEALQFPREGERMISVREVGKELK